MALPKFLQPYLPSYNIAKLNKDDLGVSNEIITQVLNLGDEKAVAWIFDNYTINEIRNAVKKPQMGVWNEESLNYWSKILKIDEVSDYSSALMNIYPV